MDTARYFDPHQRVALMVHMDLASGPLYLCSRVLPLEWQGNTWIGAGMLGAISPIEDGGGQLTGMTYTLNGVPQDVVSLARDEPVRWREVDTYTVMLADDSDAVIDFELLFSGVLDGKLISDSANGSSVSVTAEHIGQTLRRPNVWLYTHPDQQVLSTREAPFLEDDSLRNVQANATANITWPEKEALK